MTRSPGMFIWYELMTPDAAAAKAFYDAVVGWNIHARNSAPGGGMDYHMIGRTDGGFAGGLLALTAEMQSNGARPGWLGYLHVADVDATAEAIAREGGSIQMPPQTTPGVGRMAMLADPQGAPIYVMTPTLPDGNPDATSDVFSVTEAQHVRWNELQSSDPDASVAFYARHFGIVQDGEMDMGPMGKYRFIHHDGVAIGAVMPKMGESPHSAWSYYIGVDDIDRAADAVTAGGGTLNGTIMEIPGGEFSVHCSDPQGAAFGLVGPREV